MDPCAFDNEGLVKPQPFELRFYRALDMNAVSSTLQETLDEMGALPEGKERLVERVKGSIEREGLRNPFVVEWFTQDHYTPLRWLVTIGNNRYVAMKQIGYTVIPALVLFPTEIDVPELTGRYEVLDFMAALARFDATYPWWNSAALRAYCPPLVPRCV